MKKIFSFILSLLITISMMPIGNVYATVYTPEEHTLPAGGTLDVSNIRLGEFTPIIYNLDQDGATYTITGSTPSSTCLRIVIKANCTVILDKTDINAGISYDDNTENDYTGGINAHGVFEIAGRKSVNFQMQDSNRIISKNYNACHDYLLGMLLDAGAKVSFSGSGSLMLSGRIGQKIYTPVPWSGMTSYVEMNSGNVTINGFGNTARSKSGDYYLPAEAITLTYNGGNFENRKDSESSNNASTENAATGMIYRVEIPLVGNGYIKTGQDGKFGYWESNDKLYAYQSDTSKKDYYVINNDKYYHYQSGNYGNNKTATAQEINDENTIGGIKGTISIQGKPMENVQMSFIRTNSDGISYSASCTTDENGKYYASMPPGNYTLKTKIVSGSDITYKDIVTVSSESPITKDIDIKALNGQVTDNTGKGIDGATITVNQGNTSFSTKADNNGNYFIIPQGFSDGSITVKAQKIGFESINETLTWDSINGLEWSPKLDQKTSDIIEIYDEADLVDLANGENQLDGKTIELMNDIVLTGQFKGIQLSTSKTITFHGNNHTISNVIAPLFIDPLSKGNSVNYLQGEVSNLNLNGNIQINSESYSGAIASSIRNCTIDHCSFTGCMKYYCDISVPRVGGLIGNAKANANKKNIIKNCNVNFISMDWSGVIFAGGGLVGCMSSTKIYNCYVRIDKLNNNINKQSIDSLGGFVGKIFDYSPNSKTISNCYLSVNNSASSSNKMAPIVGEYEKSYNSFINNYYCGNEGAFRSDDSSQATAISLDVLKAKSGITIGDQKALVDCLNDYVKDNSTGGYRTWTLGDDSYPTFTTVKSVNAEDVTVTYNGKEHSINLIGVPEGATVTYSVDDKNYSSTKPTIVNVGTKKIYYNVTLGNETKTGSATVTVKPATIGIQWGSTTFEYDGTSHIPSATAINTIGSDSISLTVTGNATDAGNYTATVTNITGKDASNYQLPSNKTKDFTINKASQSAPENISTTAETIKGKGDGCILGVTNDMEYRKEGTNTYTAVTSDKVENLLPGKYYIRMKETKNYNASSDIEVTVESGTKQFEVNVPKSQVGYELSVSNKNVDWHGSSTVSFTLKEGYSKTDSFVVKANNQEIALDEDEKYTLSNIESNVEISVEGVKDIVAPTGTIKVNENEWKKFIKDISFGLFFKNTKDVIITSNDIGSGVDKTYYFISNKGLSENEVKNITDWTEYTSPFSVNPNNHYVIYAKIIDKFGNTSYISSDGIVIYSDSEVVTQSIAYTKTTNENKTVEVNLKGNTVNEVKNGDTLLIKNTDYLLNKEGNVILKGTYLQGLQAGKYQIQISYNPLGEIYKDNSNQNDKPNISTVELTVNKAKGSLTNISNLSKVYDGQSVNEPTFDSLSTGKKMVEYKLKGSDDATYSTKAPKDAGNYVERVSVDEDDNYSSTVSTKEFTIEQAKVTVKVNDLSKVYGDKDQELSYEVEGVIDGTSLKDITLSRKEGEDAGTYVIKATQKEGSNPNYAITFVDGTYTIKPKEIKVKATNNEKVYGEKDPKLAYTHDALVGDDTLQNIVVTRENVQDVGTYKLSVSQEKGSNPNYAIIFEEGTFTINPLSIEKAEVTLDNALRYNGKERIQKVKEVKVGNIIVPQDMYEVTGNKAVDSGIYTLTVTGKGNFTGKITYTYIVLPSNQEQVKKDDVTIGKGKISIKTESTKTKITNSQAEIINSLIDNGTITADDLVEVAKGKNIEIKLAVNNADKTIAKESKELINKEAQKSNIIVSNYLDIQLFKVIGNKENPITNTNTNIKISVQVPDSLINTSNQTKRTYYIIRNHEGKIDIIEGVYDSSTKMFTFETNQFSDYALGYEDEKVDEATIIKSSVDNSKTSVKNIENSKKIIKTGDDSSLSMWSTLLLLSGAIILIAFLDKKNIRFKKCGL